MHALYVKAVGISGLSAILWLLRISLCVVWPLLLPMFQKRRFGAISQFHYTPLPQKRGVIRLLRLLPSKDNQEDLSCELFDYDLHESDKVTHRYEALSYVWGSSDKPRSIIIQNQNLAVTENLYAALLHLREHRFTRTIWIDALCINQLDDTEKEYQIQLMAEIYATASSVIIWLGVEQDNSDRALDKIRITGERAAAISHTIEQSNSNIVSEDISVIGEGTTAISYSEPSHEAISRLLKRQWFQRIWVLQEVAAARHVLVICGSVEIDGHAFCLGLKSLDIVLPSAIFPTISLIQGAIFRPRYKLDSLKRPPLPTYSVGELFDRYHEHGATQRHDKIYALFGMISDNLSRDGLRPNYETPWSILMQRLVKYSLGDQAFVKTWDDSEVAVVKSRGYVMGQVSSATANRIDRGNIHITFENVFKNPLYSESSKIECTLLASAKPIQRGDIICLLQGAQNPSIIRPCKDHFAIIQTTAIFNSTEYGGINTMRKAFQPNEDFLRDFYLVWSWQRTSEVSNIQELLESACTEETWNGFKDISSIEKRIYSTALVLEDAKDYEMAAKWLQELVKEYRWLNGNDERSTLKPTKNLEIIYAEGQLVSNTEMLQRQILQKKRQLQGKDHQDTLNSLANLIFLYISLYDFEGVETLQVIRELTKRKRHAARIAEEDLIRIAKAQNGEKLIELLLDHIGDDITITEEIIKTAVGYPRGKDKLLKLLFDQRGDDIQITEEIIKTAVENVSEGEEAIRFLFDRKGDDIQITEEIIKTAVENMSEREEAIRFLFDRKGDDIQITEEVIKAAAGNEMCGGEIVKFLFDRRGDDIQITEEVMKAAAGNTMCGGEIVRFLLDRRGDDIQITEEVMKAAAGNTSYEGEKVLYFLFNRRGDDIQITEEVMKVAAGNTSYEGERVVKFLFDRRGDDIQITEEVIKAAAGNTMCGGKIVKFLFDRREDNIQITEEVMKVAAGNTMCGGEIVKFLFDRRGDDIQITEEVMKAAAGNNFQGKNIIELFFYWKSSQIKITNAIFDTAIESEGDAKEVSFNRRLHKRPITDKIAMIAVKMKRFEREVLRLLLDRRGDEMDVTENVLIAAAGSYNTKVVGLLLDRKGDEIKITEDVLIAAAGSSDKEVMGLLLDRKGDEIKITEDVLIAAAGSYNTEVTGLLLDRKGDEIKITEDVLIAAAGSPDKEVIGLLLDRKGDDIKITEDVLIAAAGSHSIEVIGLLLDRKGDEIDITENVLIAAAGLYDKEAMELLLDRKGDEIKITEGVLKVAAGSYDKEAMEFLLDQKGDEIKITEEVIQAALDNRRCRTEIVRLLLDRRGDGTMPSERWLRMWLKGCEERKERKEREWEREFELERRHQAY